MDAQILQILFVWCYACLVCCLTSRRELNSIIESTQDASSPFHESHFYQTTDATVYAPPSSPDAKKRKHSEDDLDGIFVRNDMSNARLPNLVLANQHVKQV